MAGKFAPPSRSSFAPPGAVKISQTALELAREFAAQVEAGSQGRPQMIVFDWSDSRAVRQPLGGPWVDLGAGLDLAAYDLQDIWDDLIQEIDGVRFAVKISRHVYEASSLRLIDTDSEARSGLTLS